MGIGKVLRGEVPTFAGTPAIAAADRVIHRALSRSPAGRYASAAAMAEDLRMALVADGSESDRGARPVTLVRRASPRGSDPELFAALVPACRYCGLLQYSLASYERAVRLDPNIGTSVQHTFFMLGDYLRAAAEAERTWAPGSSWALSLECAGHPNANRVAEIVRRQVFLRTDYGRLLQTCPSRRSLPVHASDPTRWFPTSAPGEWVRSIGPAIPA